MTVDVSPRTGVGRLRTFRPGSLLQRGLWGLCDQGLISASNFCTTVVLARTLAPTEFGAFALLYSAVFFTISLQTALVSRPHNVIGVTLQGADYRRYTTVTAVSQIGFTAVFTLITAVAAIVAHVAAWEVAPFLIPLVAVVTAWQLQEFTRRVLYTEGRLRVSFANDLVSYGGQAVTIAALGWFGNLSAVRAFWIIAATSGIGAVWGCWQIRRSLCHHGVWAAVRADRLAENWRFGKWLFGAALATWVTGQTYPLLIGGFISVAEAGAFSAVYTLMGPARILLIAMDTALAAFAARTFADHGTQALRAFVARLFLLTAPLIAAYTLLVSLFAGPILAAVFGQRFRPYGWLLAIFALSFALDYLRLPFAIALEARRVSAPIFRAYFISGVVTLTAGVAAVWFLGLLGAGLGTIANSAILGIMIWNSYRGTMALEAPDVAAVPALEGATGG
jgi:O-antigen/teichoic acid export membrane protein